jgi:predicted DNA-binding transcriptional regulator AlpA
MLVQGIEPMASAPDLFPQFITSKGLTVALRVDARTLRAWVSAGKFPAPARFGPRVIRWDAAQVKNWIENNTH